MNNYPTYFLYNHATITALTTIDDVDNDCDGNNDHNDNAHEDNNDDDKSYWDNYISWLMNFFLKGLHRMLLM